MPSEQHERVTQFAWEVEHGKVDEWLDDLAKVIKDRQAVRDYKRFRQYAVGDIVVVHNAPMGAKYLNGAKAKIVDIKLKRLTIQFLDSTIKFRGRASQVMVYPNMIRPVEPSDG